MVQLRSFAHALGFLSAVQATALPPHYRSLDSPVAARENEIDVRAQNIRIMPFGASIVEITCWRAYLWKRLQEAGITNIDFVGTRNGPTTACILDDGTAVTYDKDHQGTSGVKAVDYAKNRNLTSWLQQTGSADMILIHLGTNDFVARDSVDHVMAAYDQLLAEIRASNKNMMVVISKIIPISADKFGQSVADSFVAFNNALGQWVQKNNLLLVDNYTGFDLNTMTDEGMHPNQLGSKFMAKNFFPVVSKALAASSLQKLLAS